MNANLKALASLVLMSAVAGQAQTAATTSSAAKTPAHKTKHTRVVKSTKPTIQRQIEDLRTQMQEQNDLQKAQVDALKQQLADRDAQLQAAQAQSQQALSQAQSALAGQEAATSQNTQAVGSLQTAVTDLTANSQSLASTVQADQVATKKAIEHPDSVHFKGVDLSFTNSFIEFATVNRTRATASDIPTPFTAIPLTAADAGQLSEFYATGRQSRLALSFKGKIPSADLEAYYELDWLGTGITSNNNESNSYVMRERQLWAQAAFHNGWTVTGGQQWSLATETRHGLDNKTEVLPNTIDPNYNVGFVWERQAGLRVTKNFRNKLWVGVSAENAQTLTPSCAATGTSSGTTALACPTNYVIGAAGTNGGLYNLTAAYSYNLAPDLIAKIAIEPGWGHWEVFGVGRFFRDRVYPGAASGIANYNDSQVGGGIGGGVRGPLLHKKLEIGAHGLWGEGVGRYGAAQLADTTLRPDGQLALLHEFSVLGEIVAHPTPRLDVYADWGMEQAGRDIFRDGNGFEGYGLRTANNSGCGTEVSPGTAAGTFAPIGYVPGSPASCAGVNKDVQEGTLGYDYYFYKGPAGRFRQGIQYSYVERALWSGANGLSPKATDNVIETNIRYYLP